MVLKSNSYEEGVVQSYKVSVVFYDEEHTEWSVEQNSISGVSLPGGSDSKESAHDAGDPGLNPGFNLWGGQIPQRREWQPTPVFLPGEFHG